jgi:hypothetical protein
MAKTQPVYVASVNGELVVPGDSIVDFRGTAWVYLSAEGPRETTENWSPLNARLATRISVEVGNGTLTDLVGSAFPIVDVVPKPSLTLDEELALLARKPRLFATKEMER